MKNNKEPKLWVTVLKLVAIAAVLIGGVGAALWWASKLEQSNAPSPGGSSVKDWGIANDSPLRNKR